MPTRWARMLGLLSALAAAPLWAVNLTSLQQFTEPAKPWHDVYAHNNTYWARDLRWIVVVALLAALVLAFQGDLLRSALSILAIAGIIRADLALDRADVGQDAQRGLIAIACTLVAAAWFAGVLRAPKPNHSMLVVAAVVAAELAGFAAMAEGPEMRNPSQLRAPALLTAALLVAISLACALAATPRFSGAAVAAAAGIGMLTLTQLVWAQANPRTTFWPLILLGPLLPIATALLAYGRALHLRSLPKYLGAAAAAAFGYVVVVIIAAMVTIFGSPLGAPFTKFVGNPPVNPADEDPLHAVTGLFMGLVFSAVVLAVARLQRYAAAHPLDRFVLAPRVSRDTGLATWMVED